MNSAWKKTLNRELTRSSRSAAPLAAMMADLDYFKRINDTHGHAAGDAVLCEVARRMTATTRVYDIVGRYGGEEFLILLPGCNSLQAAKMAERLRLAVASTPMETPECKIGVTLSLGVAVTEVMRLPEAKALLLEQTQPFIGPRPTGATWWKSLNPTFRPLPLFHPEFFSCE